MKCEICPNNCLLEHNSICGRDINFDKNSIKTTAVNINPIEKKPLYHFKPGSKTLSIGTLGCNLKCLNCQNHTIAQPEDKCLVKTINYTPEDLIQIALDNNLKSISWTYNEPSIYPEWIINVAKIAKKYGIKSVLVSNGYSSKKTLEKLAHNIDAVNIDLKSMDETFYQKFCKGHLKDVLNSIKFYHEHDIHIEVTTLLIPEYNTDSISNVIKAINDIDNEIPLHFSAFYPQFKMMSVPPTKEEVIFNACESALDYGLKYVYAGNTHHSYYDNTYCKYCNELLIEREYYDVKNYIKEGVCPFCKNKADIY